MAFINDLSTLDKIAEETKRDEKHMEKASLQASAKYQSLDSSLRFNEEKEFRPKAPVAAL